ncbi:hypothetical protein JCM19231_697 [Vibrio ishigakensis]|uniref:Uncharacterized protein n=1 Tax=Vibrio ishigakensis TaxID=1481914 RepID=A0A0B8P4Z6_9VIBR|nr:hypothetical protein JCM19231_697 [Vibrio ishigakensis]GAM70007.1 hypothetical protein JCM19236_5554 [Vibrio sp. JCM 19236]
MTNITEYIFVPVSRNQLFESPKWGIFLRPVYKVVEDAKYLN